MSRIRVDDKYCTLFNIFHTSNSRDQDKIFAQWRSLPPANTQKGLLAGNFHRGLDGRSVVNYAQWESLDDYQAFRAEPGTRDRLQKAEGFARMDGTVCEVVHTSDPSPEFALDSPGLTVIILVNATPARQATVVAAMTAEDPRLEKVSGFRADAVHRDLDGGRVIKLAQWDDEESFQAFLQIPPARPAPEEAGTAEIYLTRLEYIRGLS